MSMSRPHYVIADAFSIADVVRDIQDEEAVAQSVKTYAERGKTAPSVVIKARTLGIACRGNPCDGGYCGHRLTITQGKTRYYKKHAAMGTEFFAQCKACGESDSWIYGEPKVSDTGGMMRHD